MHEQFLAAGVAVAGIDIGEAYGSPEGRKWYDALYNELTSRRGFAKKCCLLGRSRGGLWNSSWAVHNADKVAGMAGIYPVFRLVLLARRGDGCSGLPLVARRADSTAGRTQSDRAHRRAGKARVPVFLIHGDADEVVPLPQNSASRTPIHSCGECRVDPFDRGPRPGTQLLARLLPLPGTD